MIFPITKAVARNLEEISTFPCPRLIVRLHYQKIAPACKAYLLISPVLGMLKSLPLQSVQHCYHDSWQSQRGQERHSILTVWVYWVITCSVKNCNTMQFPILQSKVLVEASSSCFALDPLSTLLYLRACNYLLGAAPQRNSNPSLPFLHKGVNTLPVNRYT